MKAENRLRSIIATALDGVAVQATSPFDANTDLLAQPTNGEPVPLQVKWVGEGWPDDVRRVAANLRRPWPSNLVFLAHRFSPGAIAWLRERDGNWADEAGQARIVGPGGLIVIREPRVPAPSRRPDFKWSPSALAVTETILAHPDQPIRIPQLAEASGWSVPQVATVLKGFDMKGWTAKRGPARGRGAHRELVDPDQLLTSFSVALSGEGRTTRFAHRATRDVMAILQDRLRPALAQHVGWALSGWAGLELAAPITTAVPSLHVYVREDDFAGSLSNAIEQAGLREVSEGARVSFWRADPRVIGLARPYGGMPVVSPPRLYGDLSSFGARGQDAADHVKRELIDPLRSAEGHGRGPRPPEPQ